MLLSNLWQKGRPTLCSLGGSTGADGPNFKIWWRMGRMEEGLQVSRYSETTPLLLAFLPSVKIPLHRDSSRFHTKHRKKGGLRSLQGSEEKRAMIRSQGLGVWGDLCRELVISGLEFLFALKGSQKWCVKWSRIASCWAAPYHAGRSSNANWRGPETLLLQVGSRSRLEFCKGSSYMFSRHVGVHKSHMYAHDCAVIHLERNIHTLSDKIWM